MDICSMNWRPVWALIVTTTISSVRNTSSVRPQNKPFWPPWACRPSREIN